MSKEFFGKTILTSLDEWADPAHTALVVVDMQNDFCHVDGAGARIGRDYTGAAEIIPAIARLLASARAAGVPVIYGMNTQRADGAYLAPAEIARRVRKSGGNPLLWTIEGSWGHQVVDELTPIEGDFIIRKHRPDAFHQTDLEMLLRTLDRKSVVITGVGTRGCVDSTARGAQSRDFYIMVPRDTTASQKSEWYEAAVLLMDSLYHYTESATAIHNIWIEAARTRKQT